MSTRPLRHYCSPGTVPRTYTDTDLDRLAAVARDLGRQLGSIERGREYVVYSYALTEADELYLEQAITTLP